MPDRIEAMTMSKFLPVNAKPMISRLKELLDEYQTNSLADVRNQWAVKSVMWLLMAQVFGQFAKIDMEKLWYELYGEYKETEVGNEVL